MPGRRRFRSLGRILLGLALVVGTVPGAARNPSRVAAADTEAPVLLAPVETPYLAAYDHVALWISEPIDPTSIPDPTDFAVEVDNVPQVMADVDLIYQGLAGAPLLVDNGLPGGLALLQISWQTAVSAPGVISVTYTPGLHPIRDLAGNPLDAFAAAEAALISIDLLIGAIDEGTGPDRVILFADWPMRPELPDPDDFTVTIGARGDFTPTSITRLHPEAGATFLSLVLPTDVVDGEAVTLDYTPGVNELLDAYGAPVGALTDLEVSVSVASAPTRATPAGPNVGVTPADSTTGAALATLTFDNVTGAGTTTLTTTSTAPALPSGLSLGDPPTFFDLSTTATFVGQIEICISYGLVDFPDENALRLIHYEAGAWVDVTTLLDTGAQLICGSVSSLSPFAVAQGYPFTGFFHPVNNGPVVNLAKAGGAIPVKFSLGGDHGLNIMTAGYPASQLVACAGGQPLDVIEQTVSASASGLSYDPATGQYIYVWKTSQAWAGTCRTLVVLLNDATRRVASFQFR